MFMQRPDQRSDTLAFRRAAWLTLIVLLLLMAVIPPANAATTSATSSYTYSEKVKMAGGAWIVESEDLFSDLTIKVFHLSTFATGSGSEHWKVPQVVLFYTQKETDPQTGVVTRTEYEGFASLPEGSFDFDDALSGAQTSLTLTVSGYRCIEEDGGPQGITPECHDLDAITVDVDLAWTGTGEVLNDEFSDSIRQPGYLFHTKSTQAFRDAELSGTVAGDGVVFASGGASVGVLLKGTYTETTLMGS